MIAARHLLECRFDVCVGSLSILGPVAKLVSIVRMLVSIPRKSPEGE